LRKGLGSPQRQHGLRQENETERLQKGGVKCWERSEPVGREKEQGATLKRWETDHRGRRNHSVRNKASLNPNPSTPRASKTFVGKKHTDGSRRERRSVLHAREIKKGPDAGFEKRGHGGDGGQDPGKKTEPRLSNEKRTSPWGGKKTGGLPLFFTEEGKGGVNLQRKFKGSLLSTAPQRPTWGLSLRGSLKRQGEGGDPFRLECWPSKLGKRRGRRGRVEFKKK